MAWSDTPTASRWRSLASHEGDPLPGGAPGRPEDLSPGQPPRPARDRGRPPGSLGRLAIPRPLARRGLLGIAAGAEFLRRSPRRPSRSRPIGRPGCSCGPCPGPGGHVAGVPDVPPPPGISITSGTARGASNSSTRSRIRARRPTASRPPNTRPAARRCGRCSSTSWWGVRARPKWSGSTCRAIDGRSSRSSTAAPPGKSPSSRGTAPIATVRQAGRTPEFARSMKKAGGSPSGRVVAAALRWDCAVASIDRAAAGRRHPSLSGRLTPPCALRLRRSKSSRIIGRRTLAKAGRSGSVRGGCLSLLGESPLWRDRRAPRL